MCTNSGSVTAKTVAPLTTKALKSRHQTVYTPVSVRAVSDHQLAFKDTKCYALTLSEGFESGARYALVKAACPELEAHIKHINFTGKREPGVSHIIPINRDAGIVDFILSGFGYYPEVTIEHYRRTIAECVRVAEKLKHHTLAVAHSEPSADRSYGYIAEQATIAVNMAAYHFADYLSEPACGGHHLSEVVICTNGYTNDLKNKKEVECGIARGMAIAGAVNRARHWVDLPPTVFTPTRFAHEAEKVAHKHGLKITVFNEQQVTEMGMGGLSGVARGSDEECRFVVMEYIPEHKTSGDCLAFVGKGVTYDTGGLSIKPAEFMETMKLDMGGAAAVLASMEAIAQLKPGVRVVAFAPMTENAINGKAIKPDDILTFYNGTTAEIRDTDAEGRLILADALAYAVEQYKPTMIVDLATLTGACMRAIGPFYSGLMSNNEKVAQCLERAGQRSGDHLWRLPFGDDYASAVKSTIADICNTQNKLAGMSGATLAAHFLHHFVGDTPWAHIDIAPTAFNVPDTPYYHPRGATGVGVRLLVELAMGWGS